VPPTGLADALVDLPEVVPAGPVLELAEHGAGGEVHKHAVVAVAVPAVAEHGCARRVAALEPLDVLDVTQAVRLNPRAVAVVEDEVV
jgi:hypothetical protein